MVTYGDILARRAKGLADFLQLDTDEPILVQIDQKLLECRPWRLLRDAKPALHAVLVYQQQSLAIGRGAARRQGGCIGGSKAA